MNFQNPTFLSALLLLVIPIIIHLFNFRRYKKVMFSNVAMLKEIQTQSSKTRQIKKWLILASRMLALAALVFAFSRPFIPSANTKSGRQLISIYLDNSESMRAEGQNGQLFENAKNAAREIVQNLPKDAEIQILDNALSPFSTKAQTPANAIKLIDDMTISYYPNDFLAAAQKINYKFINEGYATQQTFALSDFQQKALPEPIALDSNLVIHLMRLVPETFQNISIDSVWLDEPVLRPQSPVRLKVKVVNNGEGTLESASLTLKINGVQQGVESFGMQAKEQKIMDLIFTTSQKGWIDGEVSVNDVPVTFDNTYHFALYAKTSINVLQIGPTSSDLSKIFGNDPVFKLNTVSEGMVDYSSFHKYDLIILNELSEVGSGLAEQLKQYADKGGVVTIIPAKDLKNYNTVSSVLGMPTYGTMSKKDLSISSDQLKQPFIRDVYKKIPPNSLLPKIARCYTVSTSSSSQTIFSLKDNTPILLRGKIGSGSIFQFTLPMDKSYSNLAQHELFVLTMLKMAFSGTEKQKLAYQMFGNEAISIGGQMSNENNLTLVSASKSTLVESAVNKGGLRFWLNNELSEAGIYSVQNKNKEPLAKIALNYPRSESIQRYASNEDLNNTLLKAQLDFMTSASAAIKKATGGLRSGTPLWKLFILLCLIFLLIEILLLRFLKS